LTSGSLAVAGQAPDWLLADGQVLQYPDAPGICPEVRPSVEPPGKHASVHMPDYPSKKRSAVFYVYRFKCRPISLSECTALHMTKRAGCPTTHQKSCINRSIRNLMLNVPSRQDLIPRFSHRSLLFSSVACSRGKFVVRPHLESCKEALQLQRAQALL